MGGIEGRDTPEGRDICIYIADLLHCIAATRGFPGSSAGKESTCNAGDPSSIPRSGRSPGERIGYPLHPLQSSFGFPQPKELVKNSPAMQETWVRSMGWEDPLEEDMATRSSILPCRIPMDREAWQAIVHGVGKSWTRLSD